MRTLLRMERLSEVEDWSAPTGIVIQPYRPGRDHESIRFVYGQAFDDDPWPVDWDRFDEFDPGGVFVAIVASAVVGFSICFPRDTFGYISVVAVVPGHRRRGVASALVRRCIDHLRSNGLDAVRIDAYEDSPPAVLTYLSLGFEIYETKEEP